MKKINAFIYTKGHFGKRIRETLDTNNHYLYSGGIHPTKIKESDLPEYYCKIHSRAIWYMEGFVRTADVKYIDYSFVDENHLFKDDYIYISYNKPIRTVTNYYGYTDYFDYDVCICGSDIIPILFFIEKYSPKVKTSYVREKIVQKFHLYRDHYPEDYHRSFLDDTDIFEYYKQFMEYHIIKKWKTDTNHSSNYLEQSSCLFHYTGKYNKLHKL